MGGKAARKARKEARSMPVVRAAMTQVDVQSYVHGFLQSRGYDLVPVVVRHKGAWQVGLYYDRGDKGFWRVGLLELREDGMREPRHLNIAVATVNKLYGSSTMPRSPSPMGELEMKVHRNELLGELHDGINADNAVSIINQIAGRFTAHLRVNPMRFDFPEEPPEEPEEPEDAEDEDLDEDLDEDVEELDE